MLFSETETAKQNQKFPFHFFFRFAVEGWGEETREKCKEIFWFLHTRVRERVRGALVRFTTQSERTMQFQATTRSARAIQSSSGFNSKYIRTSFNTHRQNSESKETDKAGSRRRRDTGAEFPPNPESKRVFHAPRGSSFANTIL